MAHHYLVMAPLDWTVYTYQHTTCIPHLKAAAGTSYREELMTSTSQRRQTNTKHRWICLETLMGVFCSTV